MKKKFTWTLIFLAVLIGGYNIWAASGRARNKKTGWTSLPNLRTQFTVWQAGNPENSRNVIGIQPYLTAKNYSTPFNFYVSLYLYVKQLKDGGYLHPQTILLFPAGIGDPLLACNEKEQIYYDSTLQQARQLMRRSNLYAYASHYLSSPAGPQRSSNALFSMKAGDMAEAYQDCFSQLAKTFSVTVVAGSILLPNPQLRHGQLIAERGPLQQVAVVFGPDGAICPPLYCGNPAAGTDSARAVHYAVSGGINLLWTGTINTFIPNRNLLAYLEADSTARSGTPRRLLAAWSRVRSNAGQPNQPESVDPVNLFGITAWQLNMNGDLWNMPLGGEALFGNRDTVYGLPSAGRKGRMISCWLAR